jgi:hypothetical protein
MGMERSFEELFRAGWVRVTFIGGVLYLHNEFRSPLDRQRRAAWDMAIETGRFDRVMWDNGDRSRDLSEGVGFREWLQPWAVDPPGSPPRDFTSARTRTSRPCPPDGL